MSTHSERLSLIHHRIAAACKLAGRSSAEVELIAVSKKHPAEAVRVMFKAGHRLFGENYATELFAKAEALADLPIKWVYIGTLQGKQIAKICQVASEIQTLCKQEHAVKLNSACAKQGKSFYPVYLAVNIGAEPTKTGLMPSVVPDFIHFVQRECPNLFLKGIMSIPRILSDEELADDAVPKEYVELHRLSLLTPGRKLSLGMSRDLEVAVRSGSSCVRIGEALFGSRSV